MRSLVTLLTSLFLFPLLLAACAQGQAEAQPPDIRYGETICDHCKMIISDERFAAGYAYEVSPGRYESIAFDDIGDMLAYADEHPEHQVTSWYVHDYNSKEWLDAQKAYYVFSNNLQTPMGHGAAAFADKAAAEKMAAEMEGELMDWEGLRARYAAGELMVQVMPEMDMPMTHDQDAMPSDQETEHASGEMPMSMEETILGGAEVEGYSLKVVSLEPLHSGYNVIMLQLQEGNGELVTGAEITLSPTMHMTDGMSHAAPVEQPQEEMPGMYRGAIAFPMPSGPDLGDWTLTVSFTDPAASVSGETSFAIEVLPSKLAGSFVAPDGSKIFLMVVRPTAPKVGAQPFEVLAVQKASAKEWPPLDDLTLEIATWMPTMDHGSPNNENPLSVGKGHYLGQVNFTMAGPWTVTLVASRDGERLGEVVFEYVIP